MNPFVKINEEQMRMTPNKKQNKETSEKHQGPGQRVQEATKLNAGNQGSPQPRIPEITESSRSGMTFTLAPSKQTPTTSGRNESGEKRKTGETGGLL